MTFPEKYFKKVNPELIFIEHHLAHASSAYRCSGFKDSAILVVDGAGEDTSTSIWIGKGNKISLLMKFKLNDSIGYFYEAASKFLGFRTDDCGKTMGLSSYGNPGYKFSNLSLKKDSEKIFDIKMGRNTSLDQQEDVISKWLEAFSKLFKKNEQGYYFDKEYCSILNKLSFSEQYKNLAASVQDETNKLMIELSKLALKSANSENLCISGGVGLNCVANGKILEENICKNLFIQPLCNDAGVSLGAAMEFISGKREDVNFEMKSVYLGPEFNNGDIKKILESKKLKFRFLEDPAKEGAKLISEGKILGWFQGRMEAGPRALGNRSILADPTNPKIKDIVNNVKYRELWRPLCPSVLEEKKLDYINIDKESPFMIIDFEVKKEAVKKIPSVVHVDGTARIQTVNKNINPLYWRLINEFGKISGEYAVLNTSLNSKAKPIAASPIDAIKNFYNSGMDAIIIGNYLLTK
jgi:carbamoyltransferase